MEKRKRKNTCAIDGAWILQVSRTLNLSLTCDNFHSSQPVLELDMKKKSENSRHMLFVTFFSRPCSWQHGLHSPLVGWAQEY
jgi:hypothetical protein